MKKFKKHRASVEFEYEFADGAVETFTYLSTTTNQIEKYALDPFSKLNQ